MATYLVRLSGALPGGEIWTSGVHCEGAGSLSDLISPVDDLVDTLWNGDGTVDGIGGYYPSTVTLTSAVAYSLAPATGLATGRIDSGYLNAGTVIDDPLPQEVAVVATLRTAGVGPAARGRMYLPGPVVGNVTALGRLDAAVRLGMCGSLAAALRVLVAASFTPVLFTKAVANRPITVVDVGDVFDAQRRRRDKLVEVRTVIAL
jgi:hypothetical protein